MEDFQRVNELTRQKILRRKKQRRKQLIMHALLCSSIVIILLTVVVIALSIKSAEAEAQRKKELEKYIENPPGYTQQLLTVNAFSRPGTELEEVNGVVIHYTANPGTTAMQNRNYFEGLKDSKSTKASSHFIIGQFFPVIS